MTDKSYVSLETAVCPVCGKEHETGSILMDRRLRDSMDRTTCTGYELCDEHKKLWDDGFVALVGVDEFKSHFDSDGNLQMANAHRSGDLLHINERGWSVIFTVKFPKVPFVFIGQEVIELIKHRLPQEGA